MLKKLSFAIAFVALSYSSFAQHDFRKFRVDVGLGYAIPKGGGGVLFAVEPKYAVIENKLSTGLRMEWAGMAKEVNGTNGSVSFAGSYLLTGDYHFTQSTARPFAGLGLGLYSIASVGTDFSTGTTGTTVAGGTEFGFMLRGGVDVAHCRFALEYNLVPSSDATAYDMNTGNNRTIKVKNSYLGVKFSVYIGGGKK